MTKIGRNEPCPCGSGKKYKHCCARTGQPPARPATPEERLRVSLMAAVAACTDEAGKRKRSLRELGVFVLVSTEEGNAWLFESTQSDCVQLAAAGDPLPVPIDENPKTIEIEWSHTFRIRARQMVLTAYADKAESVLTDLPVQQVAAAVKRIRKKVPPEMLSQIHIG